jgi:PAS domain S-box-containing protein
VQLDLTQQMLGLRQGDHLCLFYDRDPAEQMPALVPFIQQGLRSAEQCIYIADDQTVDQFADHLARSGINVATECDRGSLKLWTRREWRQAGELSSEKKAGQVRDFMAESRRSGFKGVRFGVEMTWTLGPDIDADRLEHWEATINEIFAPGVPGRIICQYNRSRLAAEVMLAALHTHPLAIFGGDVYPNLFYQGPLILNGNGHGKGDPGANGRRPGASTRVEWMISQLKRARAAEREREALIQARAALVEATADRRLAAIVESSDDAIISKDLHGIITTWNPGAKRIFGYTDEEVIGKSITIIIPPERRDEEREILNRIREGERIEHYETIRQRKDGTLLDISLTVSPLVDDEGRVVGASKIARDITERKRAEAALRKAQEELGRTNEELESRVTARTAELAETNSHLEAFVYSIAHDLRAPLRSMQAFSSMLLEEYGANLDDAGKHYARRVVRAAESMDMMVLDLLAYGRVARSSLELGPANVGSAWAAAVAQNEHLIREKNAFVETTAALPTVRAHQATLTQVFANLLGNALKFVPAGIMPRVRLWAESRPDIVRLWVEDNGIGIAPEHHERIFRVFERLNGQDYGGTGIGLSIVRKGIERMGGRVGVESKLGQGSRFWVELLKA